MTSSTSLPAKLICYILKDAPTTEPPMKVTLLTGLVAWKYSPPPNPTSTNTLHRHRRARHVQTHANEDYSTLQCTYMHANTVPVSVTCCKRREHVQCVAHRTNPGTWTGRMWSITLYIYIFFSQIFQ